jgi:hypothetical protein
VTTEQKSQRAFNDNQVIGQFEGMNFRGGTNHNLKNCEDFRQHHVQKLKSLNSSLIQPA